MMTRIIMKIDFISSVTIDQKCKHGGYSEKIYNHSHLQYSF